jgi:hypothetical protein
LTRQVWCSSSVCNQHERPLSTRRCILSHCTNRSIYQKLNTTSTRLTIISSYKSTKAATTSHKNTVTTTKTSTTVHKKISITKPSTTTKALPTTTTKKNIITTTIRQNKSTMKSTQRTG